MKKTAVWINGKIVPEKRAGISVFDRGFLYGDGVFETMRSYAGVVFKMEEHLGRLFSSLKILGIRPSHSKRGIENAIYGILKKCGLKSAYIRIAITRGEGLGIGSTCPSGPNNVIIAKELKEYPDWAYRKGISAKVAGIKQNEHSLLTSIKSLNFLNYIMARAEAKRAGCDEAILRNTNSYIAEGATSNIFLVKTGRLVTPSLSSGILPGITRQAIIGIAKGLKIPVKEKAVSYAEMLGSDEVFLTNSIAEVLGVVKIDSRKIGRGVPGEITKLLHISYQKNVIRQVIGRA